MAIRILVMGLPGSGKTIFSECLLKKFIASDIDVKWFNADDIRNKFNDWDFSYEGRIRQSHRMREFADECNTDIVICDFIAPLIEMRNIFGADCIIWLDTIRQSKYSDTDKIFIEPTDYDFRIKEKNANKWSEIVFKHILNNSL